MTYEQSVLLTGSQWTELSEERKLEVLQTIENHSAFEAGRLSCPVVGKFLYTGTDGVVLGTYDPKNQVIYVNSSQFASDSRYGKDSEAIVTACLHEGRHAYQHQVTDGTVLHDNQVEQMHGKRTSRKAITFHSETIPEHTIISRLRWTLADLLKKSIQKSLRKGSLTILSHTRATNKKIFLKSIYLIKRQMKRQKLHCFNRPMEKQVEYPLNEKSAVTIPLI